MTAAVFLAVVVAWMAWGAISLVMVAPVSILLALVLGFGAVFALRDTVAVGGVMALLEPIGIVLPLLILRQMASAMGWEFPAFGSAELLIFLGLYVVFLTTAFGVIPVDLYRYGYAPLPVAGCVLLLCLYGALSGNWFVPLVAVAGQAMWVSGMGSSNYLDHVLHVSLVPVVAIVLLSRVVG